MDWKPPPRARLLALLLWAQIVAFRTVASDRVAVTSHPPPSTPPSVCPKSAELSPILIKLQSRCGIRSPGEASALESRVHEMDASHLERTLKLLQHSERRHIAVLFYAKWCPFSMSLRTKFDILSVTFPSVYHIAVENLDRWPSLLTQYGVHSFPCLFLHNKKIRMRYNGHKTIKSLVHFYEGKTGLHPINLEEHNLPFEDEQGIQIMAPRGSSHWRQIKRRAATNTWYGNDIYLSLATLFVLMRILHYGLPKFGSIIKHFWVQNKLVWLALCSVVKRELRLVEKKQGGSTCKVNERGKGKLVAESLHETMAIRRGLSVSGWSTSTLSESSSTRVGAFEDGWENRRK